jgi:hypothetical protein
MITMNRQQAADAVARASAERDTIQTNLLELDNSFGKRLLTGAQLTGISAQRWEKAAATLAALWDTYATYSAVVEKAIGVAGGKLGQKELAEITALLTLPSVEVTRARTPLSRRDLADTGRDQLTLSTAVSRMREAFAEVTDVVSAAEQAWNTVAGPLDAAGASLAQADAPGDAAAGGPGQSDEALLSEITQLRSDLERQRAALNSDPLGADLPSANRLRDRAAAVAARAAELASVRTGAVERIAALRTAAEAVSGARSDALLAYQRAAARLTSVPPVPDALDPAAPLARLDSLLAAGRWTTLSSELTRLERDLAAELDKFRESERTVVALLGRRDELRGLLDAYKAKAARLGAAEDADLSRMYDQTRDLLWTAPCDLEVATAAVSGYQQAVLAIGARRL